MTESTEVVHATVLSQAPAVDSMNPRMREFIQTQLTPSKRQPTWGEVALFAEYVDRTGLSPFNRQIYGIYRADRRGKGPRQVVTVSGQELVSDEYLTIQVAIDGLRLVAQRTGSYEGQDAVLYCGDDREWTEVWLGTVPPAAAKATVWKAGSRRPTVMVALWAEYKSNGPLKGQMPAHMLGKIAEAFALRKAFPADTSGLYIPEEMHQADRPAAPAATGTVDLPAETPIPEADVVEPAPEVTAREPEDTVQLASTAQRRKIFAELKNNNLDETVLKKIVAALIGKPHTDRLPADQVDAVLTAIGDPDAFFAQREAETAAA